MSAVDLTIIPKEKIVNNVVTLKRVAIVLTFVLYKSTKIRDFHCDANFGDEIITLNKQHYKMIYNEVFTNVKKYINVTNSLIKAVEENKYNQEKLSEEEKEIIELVVYYSKMGQIWPLPMETKIKDIEQLNNAENITNYILGGFFEYSCNTNQRYSDEVEKVIDKDICEKIYALLCNGLLNYLAY